MGGELPTLGPLGDTKASHKTPPQQAGYMGTVLGGWYRRPQHGGGGLESARGARQQ